MKFFRIGCEKQGNEVPEILNWSEKLDYHMVQSGEIMKLPRRTLLFVKSRPEKVFADILDTPFFQVSEMVWKVMKLYDGSVKGRQLILLDDLYGVSEIYFMPLISVCQYPTSKKEWDALPTFFRLEGDKKSTMIGRLDFVESILKRGAKGIFLEELEFNENS